MSFYPVAWQGYVVLVVFILLMAVSSLAIAKSLLLFFGIEFGLVVVLMIVVSSTSDF